MDIALPKNVSLSMQDDSAYLLIFNSSKGIPVTLKIIFFRLIRTVLSNNASSNQKGLCDSLCDGIWSAGTISHTSFFFFFLISRCSSECPKIIVIARISWSEDILSRGIWEIVVQVGKFYRNNAGIWKLCGWIIINKHENVVLQSMS